MSNDGIHTPVQEQPYLRSNQALSQFWGHNIDGPHLQTYPQRVVPILPQRSALPPSDTLVPGEPMAHAWGPPQLFSGSTMSAAEGQNYYSGYPTTCSSQNPTDAQTPYMLTCLPYDEYSSDALAMNESGAASEELGLDRSYTMHGLSAFWQSFGSRYNVSTTRLRAQSPEPTSHAHPSKMSSKTSKRTYPPGANLDRIVKKSKKPERASFPCGPCRMRRTKCDEDLPRCGRCKSHNSICTYEQSSEHTHTNVSAAGFDTIVKRVDALDKRMQECEQSIIEFRGEMSCKCITKGPSIRKIAETS